MKISSVRKAVVALFAITVVGVGPFTGPLAASKTVAGDKWPPYPRALQGIWFDNNAEGRAQCQAYKSADKTDRDEVSGRLVGGVLISGSIMHAYSEYGEGNFYQLRRLEKVGRDNWRVAVAVGIDTVPEASQAEDDVFAVQLFKAVLTVRTKPQALDLKESWRVAYRLRRCADVPAGIYRRRAA